MGKVTYKRVIAVPARNKILAALPLVGGFLFIIGSAYFWPGFKSDDTRAGAVCFLLGSLCYLLQPFSDYYDMTCNKAVLVDGATLENEEKWYDWGETDVVKKMNENPDYEFLYKAQLVRIQASNACIYAVGAVCFVSGSVFFFPEFEDQIVHGGWLYIVGCLIVTTGASLGAATAHELRKTAKRVDYGSSWLALPWWTDEGATIISCAIYCAGNFVYVLGSIFFFPGIIKEFGDPMRYAGVIFFLTGSVLFTGAAAIDLLVLLRVGDVQEDTHEKTTGIKHGHGHNETEYTPLVSGKVKQGSPELDETDKKE